MGRNNFKTERRNIWGEAALEKPWKPNKPPSTSWHRDGLSTFLEKATVSGYVKQEEQLDKTVVSRNTKYSEIEN